MLAVVIVVATLAPAMAQDDTRLEGTVQSAFGQTLTLLSDAPENPGYATIGRSLEPVPPAQPRINVDLSQLPLSEYAFIRPGERVSVIGVVSRDGRRVTATTIIRGAGPQSP